MRGECKPGTGLGLVTGEGRRSGVCSRHMEGDREATADGGAGVGVPLSGFMGSVPGSQMGFRVAGEESPASALSSEKVGLNICAGVGGGVPASQRPQPLLPCVSCSASESKGPCFFLHLEAIIFLPKCFKNCICRSIFKITGNFINCARTLLVSVCLSFW